MQIDESWEKVLDEQFRKNYFIDIMNFLKAEIDACKVIYPDGGQIFNAFQKTPLQHVKVVILGQDPYHGPGQAMGLSFSVPKGIKIPASLKRIYAELERNIGFKLPDHGDLTYWAQQGVFLLNAILTVEAGEAGSHRKIGWQNFTDEVIRTISNKNEGVVFMLWGNFAKKKSELIDSEKHLILKAAHPSPLAGNKFSDCKHFSKANDYFKNRGEKEIDWQLK